MQSVAQITVSQDVNNPQISFSERVLAWFADHGRKDLPWQLNKTLYSVWVSEIMLQQTQVKTVIPFYQKFISRFPDITSLANAEQDEVLHLWTGLGYYARARNLQKAAQRIRDEFDGQFPQTLDEALSLPGIGRSTAGAVLALASGQHHSILDGNVKRVLARYFAIEGWPGNKRVEQQLWYYADELTPAKQTADYTQAMMDLGATVCSRSKPNCDSCPLQTNCLAFAQGRQSELPSKKPKTDIPVRTTVMLIPVWQGHVLIYQRPPSGLWGGLWGFYETQDKSNIQPQKDLLAIPECPSTFLPAFRHTFSHFHLDIQPVILQLTDKPRAGVQDSKQMWYDLHNPQNVGLAAPTQKLLAICKGEL